LRNTGLPLCAAVAGAILSGLFFARWICSARSTLMYDSLIVAAAIQAIARFFTAKPAHGRRFGDLVVQNPFL